MKQDLTNTGIISGKYYTVRVQFNKTATISSAIDKMIMTYQSKFGPMNIDRNMQTASDYHTWHDYISLLRYSSKKEGPLTLIFKAYNSKGEMICTGHTQKF